MKIVRQLQTNSSAMRFLLLLFVVGIHRNVLAQELPKPLLIRLQTTQKEITLNAEDGLEIIEKTGSRIKKTVTCQIQNSSIFIDGKDAGSDEITIHPRGGLLKINQTLYRGFLELRAKNNLLELINHVEIEDYLKGVLPKEMSPNWPLEALKAQAVAARTYALSHIDSHGKENFNLCSGVHCQVYGGASGEGPLSNQAVEETRGEVLLYKNDLASTYFFANCGGHTESIDSAWGGKKISYLEGVRCTICAAQPRDWQRTFTEAEIATALAQENIAPPIKKIQIAKKNRSGRAETIRIQDRTQSISIDGAKLRMRLGPDKMRSTFLNHIKKTGKGYLFTGRGWGHGIGLCQEGAKGYAQRNWNYKKILLHYYPNCQLQKF